MFLVPFFKKLHLCSDFVLNFGNFCDCSFCTSLLPTALVKVELDNNLTEYEPGFDFCYFLQALIFRGPFYEVTHVFDKYHALWKTLRIGSRPGCHTLDTKQEWWSQGVFFFATSCGYAFFMKYFLWENLCFIRPNTIKTL